MGEVWLAEQKQPVQRRVAVKLIKAGMDTREVIGRFESERQALALMNHPSIAKVFDAGSTAEGHSYFVMEYVAGLPITAFCDRHRLNTRQRLELLIAVCEGVQHAHQKAIIHRDLKPSNILVTEVDGKPLPHIIDFGVAKATAQRLNVKTLHTEIGALVGTFGYISPELADLSNSYSLVSSMRPVPFGLDDMARLAAATAASFLPLLLTVFSPEELIMRLAKVVF